MTPKQLRSRIARLEADQPIAARFEKTIADRATRKKDPWYATQKEHWLGWLGEYDGPGYYGRAEWDVSAQTVFNRVVNPSMVLWLCEASGVSAKHVKAAAEAALQAGERMSAQSGAIRKHVNWAMIESALRENHKRS